MRGRSLCDSVTSRLRSPLRDRLCGWFGSSFLGRHASGAALDSLEEINCGEKLLVRSWDDDCTSDKCEFRTERAMP